MPQSMDPHPLQEMWAGIGKTYQAQVLLGQDYVAFVLLESMESLS